MQRKSAMVLPLVSLRMTRVPNVRGLALVQRASRGRSPFRRPMRCLGSALIQSQPIEGLRVAALHHKTVV